MKEQYPETVVRVMRPQILNATLAAMHHYRHRHDGRGLAIVRDWIAEVRRLDRSSGYSDAMQQLRETQ